MPAVVSIVGHSNSGKTTLIEKLIPELKSRGYRVATIKRAQEITLGDMGRDNRRHLQAGSEVAIVSSPEEMVLVKPVASAMTIDEIVPFLGEDYDIIITEGFKQDDAPKIEVHRKETGPPLKDLKKLFAIVTDEPLKTKTRQFSFDDIKGLADLLEEGFLKPKSERISLYVNNTPITLTSFPKDIITNILLAMASSLKGVGKISSLKIFLRKRE